MYSRTTAALTNLEDHEDVDDAMRRNSKGTAVPAAAGDGHTRYLVPATFSRAGSAGMSDDSDFSDEDSLCSSVHSADSVETAASKHATIRYSESVAGQIWNILHRMDEMVLQVKVGVLFCVSPAWLPFVLKTTGIFLFLVPRNFLSSRPLRVSALIARTV